MKIIDLRFLTLLLLSVFLMASCDDDDVTPDVDDPIASFQFEISADNFLEVTFSNFSQDGETYNWNFGDGNTSTEESPVHVYAAAGTYTVSLTATNDSGDHTATKDVTIVDPNEALKLLTGDVSKTWKLFREGTCLSLGENADNPAGWWSGLSNNGARPCLYEQEFTFHLDGTFVFDDKGTFWGEDNPWAGTAQHETCFEPTAANMVNKDGADVSAWGSGTHQFSYDASIGKITLTGMGAWMGFVHTVGLPNYFSSVPTATRTFDATITQENGYDLLTIVYPHDPNGIWTCVYASYSDPSLEPEIETEAEVFGEDLPDVTPTEMFYTFASKDAGETAVIDTTASVSGIILGVDDPADASANKVGQFLRGGDLYQELKFQTAPEANDIIFSNLTTVSLDVYLPSSNTYAADGLTKAVIIGVADQSATEQWWTDNREWVNDGTSLETDKWITLTYQLDSPNAGAGAYTPFDRNDLDMIYINIGGGGHAGTGTFYVRNFRFE